MKKWFGTDPKQFLSLVLLCLRTLILLPLYVHQTCPPRNESRCTSHRWLSPDRFKIYWFASILNQMTMKIRAEFVPGFWRVAKWGSWSCFTRGFFWKNSRVTCRKRKPSNLFFCVQGYWEILIFSRNERGNWRVTYISGGKSRPTLVHKFTNHARLSLKFTLHILILASITRHV